MRTRPLCPDAQQARFSGSVIGHRRCAHCDQPGGFGRSDKISMHCGEAVGPRGRARSRVAAGATMRQFMITVTALAAFAATVATAQAEILHGGPIKNGNQCFKYSAGNDKDGRFGTWGACSQETSGRPRAAPRLLPSELRWPDRQLEGRAFTAMTSTAHAECLSSAGAVWNAHPGSHATWRLAGHQGTKCWFARGPKIVQAPRIRWVADSPRARTAEPRTDGHQNPARLESEQVFPSGEREPPSILLWGTPLRIDPTWEDLFERRARGAE
jgi:hypothetical protein